MYQFTFDKNRIISFSDAVFSIAMTLLVLEIEVPTYQSFGKYDTWLLLEARIPNFIGFIVSFFVTALYWINYMKITKYVSDFSSKLLWMNILVLFFVVMLPFTTGFYVNGINHVGPFVIYSINLSMIAAMILIMTRLIYKKEQGKTGLTSSITNWLSARLLTTLCVWALAAIVDALYVELARFIFVLIFIINPLIDRYYKRKILKE